MADRGNPRRRWVWGGAVLLILAAVAAAIALVAWPSALRLSAAAALSDATGRDVQVRAARLNLATGRGALRDVIIGVGAAPAARIGHLVLDLDIRSLWRKRIRLDSAVLRDADIEVRRLADGRVRVAGFDLPTDGGGAVGGAGWAVGVDSVEIADVGIIYRDGDTVQRLAIGRFSVSELATWRDDARSPVAFEGKLDTGALRVTGQMSPFSAESRGSFDIKIDDLPIAPLALPARAAGLAAVTGAMSADLRLTLSGAGDGLSGMLSGDATLVGLTLAADGSAGASEAADLTADEFRLRGLRAEGSVGPDGWAAALRLDAVLRRAVFRAMGIEAESGLLRWTGNIAVEAPSGDGPAVSAKGRVEGAEFRARRAGGADILAFRDAGVGRVEIDGAGAVRLGDVTVRDGRADPAGRRADGASPPIVWTRLAIDAAEMSPARRIQVRRVTADGLALQVQRGADGRVAWPWTVAPVGADAAPTADASPRVDAAPPDVLVAEVAVKEGRLAYRDSAVTPHVDIVADPVSLRLSGLDSRPAAPPAVLVVNAGIGEFGRARIEGTIRPFAAPASLDLTGSLADIELPRLSPYMARYLGYEIGRGRLNAEVETTLAANKVSAKSELEIRKLTLKPRDGADGEAAQADIGVPLTTAVSLLRDSDDVIRLSVPVEGDLDNPRFDFSDAVNTALGNTLKTTVTATLNVLFPVTGLLTVVQLAGEAHLRFPPLPFPPGGADIPDDGSYVADLAGLMQKRPGVAVSLCGKAAEADRAALAAANAKPGARRQPVDDDALRQLAAKRAEAVREQLSAAHGIARERFFLCAPEIDAAPDAAPRVEVLL